VKSTRSTNHKLTYRPNTTTGFSTGKEAATSGSKRLQSTAPGFHPISIHQMAPPEQGSTHPINNLLLIYRPRKDERLSWPGWLTCRGRFTHISGHPLHGYRPSAGQGQFAGQWPTFYHCATQPTYFMAWCDAVTTSFQLRRISQNCDCGNVLCSSWWQWPADSFLECVWSKWLFTTFAQSGRSNVRFISNVTSDCDEFRRYKSLKTDS